jgi:hypothetical protein
LSKKNPKQGLPKWQEHKKIDARKVHKAENKSTTNKSNYKTLKE